jgi:hypothetical protein
VPADRFGVFMVVIRGGTAGESLLQGRLFVMQGRFVIVLTVMWGVSLQVACIGHMRRLGTGACA